MFRRIPGGVSVMRRESAMRIVEVGAYASAKTERRNEPEKRETVCVVIGDRRLPLPDRRRRDGD
jgi:hypothetical protein